MLGRRLPIVGCEQAELERRGVLVERDQHLLSVGGKRVRIELHGVSDSSKTPRVSTMAGFVAGPGALAAGPVSWSLPGGELVVGGRPDAAENRARARKTSGRVGRCLSAPRGRRIGRRGPCRTGADRCPGPAPRRS